MEGVKASPREEKASRAAGESSPRRTRACLIKELILACRASPPALVEVLQLSLRSPQRRFFLLSSPLLADSCSVLPKNGAALRSARLGHEEFLFGDTVGTAAGQGAHRSSPADTELEPGTLLHADGVWARGTRLLTNISLHYCPLLASLPPPLSLPPSLHLSLPPSFSTFSLAHLQLLIFTRRIWQLIPTPLPPHPALLLAFPVCWFLPPKTSTRYLEPGSKRAGVRLGIRNRHSASSTPTSTPEHTASF